MSSVGNTRDHRRRDNLSLGFLIFSSLIGWLGEPKKRMDTGDIMKKQKIDLECEGI